MCVCVYTHVHCVCVCACACAGRLEGLVPLPDHPLPCSFTPSITGQTESALCWKPAGGSSLVGLSRQYRGSCSQGWCLERPGLEVPAWGVSDDCRPSAWMLRLGQCERVPSRERLKAGGPRLYGGALAVSISTAVAANGVWAGRDLPQHRAHCSHPSARAGRSGEGACSVTGVTPTGGSSLSPPQGQGGPGGHCPPQAKESISLYTQARTLPLSGGPGDPRDDLGSQIPLVHKGCV